MLSVIYFDMVNGCGTYNSQSNVHYKIITISSTYVPQRSPFIFKPEMATHIGAIVPVLRDFSTFSSVISLLRVSASFTSCRLYLTARAERHFACKLSLETFFHVTETRLRCCNKRSRDRNIETTSLPSRR